MIKDRALKALNLEQYKDTNRPEWVGEIDLKLPSERQYILRMLIKRPFGECKLPKELEWCKPMVDKAFNTQLKMGIRQPFCYLTIRNGLVDSETDDEWHVDGFSQTITHLPEQNYIWVDNNPTEFIVKEIDIPYDFDSSKHNIHYFIDDNITENDVVKTMNEKTIYCLDPYVIHRRPKLTKGTQRCFIRVSFTPIEIEDCNNTINPLISTNYKRDGVKSFRKNLIQYK